MTEPANTLLELLRAYPPGQLFRLAPKVSVTRGFEYFRRGSLSEFSWNDDRSVLTATVIGRARYLVAVGADGSELEFACTCPAWGPLDNCKHVVCAALTIKNLLNPGSFTVQGWGPGKREALLRQIEAATPGDTLAAAARGRVERGASAASANRKQAAGTGFAVAIAPGRPIADVLLVRDGHPAQGHRDYAACPPELRGLLSPYQRLDRYGKTWFLAQYLANHGGKHPLLLQTPDGERALRYLASPDDAARTELDAGPGGVSAAKIFLLGGTELRGAQVGDGIALDVEGGAISAVIDRRGWRIWNDISALLPFPGAEELSFGHGGDSPGDEELGDDEALSKTALAELLSRTPVYLPADEGAPPPTLQLKIEGRPVAAAEVQPRYRLSILPGGDPDDRLLRAEVVLGDRAVPPHPALSGFLQFSQIRVSQPLRANKRRSVLCAAFLEMLAAPTAREAQGAIARAARHEAIDRYRLRHEVRDLLQANLAASRQSWRALLLEDARWVTAPVEMRRQLDLYRVPFAVFGWEIFREMPDAELMRVPAETLDARLPQLLEALDAAGIELLQGGTPVRGAAWEFSFDARREEGIDWFEIRPEIRCDGRLLGARDMKRILKGGGTVEIGGQLRVVDAASREVLALLGGVRGGSAAKKGGDREIVEVPRLRILDWIHLRRHGVVVHLPPEDEAVVDRLLHFERLEERPLPAGLLAKLRPYQREGWHWLAFLYEHGFGACLADDMGLGKTLQAIILLGGIKEGLVRAPGGGGRRPHLIVVPPSLLFNWESEIRKFFPGLAVAAYAGAERSLDFGAADAVLTTYGLVRRDLARLKEVPFDVIVFDEAQAVKNAAADTTSAVRQLQARFKLAMTGTPVENHLGEFVSILDLAVPGLLADVKEGQVEQIIRRTRPFVLRRTKEQILRELPPKVETDIYLELTEHQKMLYRRTVESVKTTIEAAYRSRTAAQARIIALTALLRLRQICVSPRLVDPAHHEPSPKIGFLIAQLRELLDEGHRALVFSQFTSFLDLLEPELERGGIAFVRLDGSTPTAKRRKIVEGFQSDAGPGVFLLSLKAGGQGLNLTSASYVFHLDPWWNPAVENQASDRTHRIGQRRTVTITRILMRHTIEEKMMALKQRKLGLYRAVLTGAETGGGGAALSREDLAFLLG
jgi:non-specific serine/threonine protein kinase